MGLTCSSRSSHPSSLVRRLWREDRGSGSGDLLLATAAAFFVAILLVGVAWVGMILFFGIGGD